MAPSNAAADIDSIEAQLEAEYRGLQQAQDRFAYIAYTLAGANGKDYASVPVTKVQRMCRVTGLASERNAGTALCLAGIRI
jgi:hypothetical protein